MAEKTFDLSVLFKMKDRFSAPMRQAVHNFNKFYDTAKRADSVSRRFGQNIGDIGRKLSGVGQRLSLMTTAPLIAFGLSSLKVARDFDYAMNMVGGVTRTKIGEEVTPAFHSLRKLAKDLGATTIYTATQVAEGMQVLGLKGLTVKEIFAVMPKVLELATSAQMDIAQAGDIVVGVMNSQKLAIEDLSRVNDVLVSAFTRSSASLASLGESFKYAGAVTRDTGMSLEETAASLAYMAKMNIDAAMAGTALRGAMIRMANPSKQMIDLFSKMGIKIFQMKDGKRKLLPIIEILREFEKSGIGAEQLSAPGIFGMRAGPGFAALLGQSENIKNLIQMMGEDVGIATKIAQTQMSGLPKVLFELTAAWEIVRISFTESSFGQQIQKVFGGLTKILRGIADTNPDTLAMVATFLALAAVLAPLVMLLGWFAAGVAAIIANAGVIAVIAGMAVAAAAYGYIVKTLIDNWEYLKQVVVDVFDTMMDHFNLIKSKFKSFINLLPNKIRSQFPEFFGDGEITQKQSISNIAVGDINNKSQTDINIKVKSDNGSSATIEGVKNKGNSNVNIINDIHLGVNMSPTGAF